MTDEIKTAWVSKGWRKSKKPWGHEMVWSSFTSGHGKLLFIEKGGRTSLKYNPQKNESLVVIAGTVEVTYGDEKTLENLRTHPFQKDTLEPGDCLHVQSQCPYRMKALTDCQIVEIGNYLNDKPVRIEDDYGRTNKKNS